MLTVRCTGCPRTSAGLPSCIGLTCPAYCATIAEGHQRFITRIITWQPMPAEDASYSNEYVAVAFRPSVTESLSILGRMKACPNRTDEIRCGCGGLAKCGLGKGHDGLVNHADCIECLQRPVEGNGPPAE